METANFNETNNVFAIKIEFIKQYPNVQTNLAPKAFLLK